VGDVELMMVVFAELEPGFKFLLEAGFMLAEVAVGVLLLAEFLAGARTEVKGAEGRPVSAFPCSLPEA
jgi:hypothetical protein